MILQTALYAPAINLSMLLMGVASLISFAATIILFIFGIKYINDDEISGSFLFIIIFGLLIVSGVVMALIIGSMGMPGISFYSIITLITFFLSLAINACYIIYGSLNIKEKGVLVLIYGIVSAVRGGFGMILEFSYYSIILFQFIAVIATALLLIYGILIKNPLFAVAGGLMTGAQVLMLIVYLGFGYPYF